MDNTNIEQVVKEQTDMIDWFVKNMDKLPLFMQFRIASAWLTFNDQLKTLYVQALMLTGEDQR